MAFGILVSEKCSDICAETVDTGFRADLQCFTTNFPLFLFLDWLVVSDV
jgi:hypothetical protein